MALEFRTATRHAVPMIMSISGASGSGKTFSALRVASGLVEPGGKVGFIDTENRRGCFYADSPTIKADLPQGYQIADLDQPFSPARYIDAIDAAEKAGVGVLVIDSGSHEWEGYGGCSEMAEADKNRWNRAKRENRRYVYRLLYSPMHIIVCLRAREKTKIIPKHQSPTGKEEVMSLGVLPICEKNFVFEMLLSLQLDEKTHLATPIKVPEFAEGLFPGGRLLTKEDGVRIREWNNGAPREDPSERLKGLARMAASNGGAEYREFYQSLTGQQKVAIKSSVHEECKYIAEQADAAQAAAQEA